MKSLYFLVLAISFTACNSDNNCLTEKIKTIYLPLEIKGVVIKSYRNFDNRGLHNIDINQKEETITYPRDLDLSSKFYLNAEQGDSIYKKAGSLSFTLVKKDTTIFYKNNCVE